MPNPKQVRKGKRNAASVSVPSTNPSRSEKIPEPSSSAVEGDKQITRWLYLGDQVLGSSDPRENNEK
jgi:hypothetical protein